MTTPPVEVAQCGVRNLSDGISGGSVGSVGELQCVEGGGDGGADVVLDEPLEALHHYRHQGHWAIVLWASDSPVVLRHGDDDGFFKTCGDYRLGQGSVEDGGKHRNKLISTGL